MTMKKTASKKPQKTRLKAGFKIYGFLKRVGRRDLPHLVGQQG